MAVVVLLLALAVTAFAGWIMWNAPVQTVDDMGAPLRSLRDNLADARRQMFNDGRSRDRSAVWTG